MKHKMNPNLVKVASLDVLAHDLLEAMKIANSLSRLYYNRRENGTCVITVTGGRIVNGKKDFNKAVSEIEAEVRTTTNLSFSIVKKNTVLLRRCRRLLDNGEVSEPIYAYHPPNAKLGDPVELFSYSRDKTFLSYLLRGTLVDFINDIVFVDV